MDYQLQNIIEIRDNIIDSQKIVKEIQTQIQQHRQQINDTTYYDQYVQNLYDTTLDPTLIERPIDSENNIIHYDNITLKISLTPPPNIPVLGQLWQRIRLIFHRLVLFYVNMFAYRQMEVNRYLYQTIQILLEERKNYLAENQVDAMRQEIFRLQQEIQILKDSQKNDIEPPTSDC